MDELLSMSTRRLQGTKIILLVFILVGLGAYANVLSSFFVADDFYLIQAVSERGPFGIWSRTRGGYFRPLISLSLFVERKLWGLNPLGYHVINVVVHSFSSFLVFRISSLFMNAKGTQRDDLHILSLLSGFTFLLLASHAEPVAWISGRTDVFATFFCVASLYAYLLHRGCSRRLHLLLSGIFFYKRSRGLC